MNENIKKYYVRLENNQIIEVSKEVYIAYYSMKREEKYQKERDLKHGLLYYDDWDTEEINGVEFIKDKNVNIDENIMFQELYEALLNFENIYDEQKILLLLASGEKESNIAKRLKMSQSTVNRKKVRLLILLREYLEEFV